MKQTFFDEELHKALKNATFAIQDYIEPYRKNGDYLERLKFILLGVVSSTVEIENTLTSCADGYLWSELENMAKNGGLTAVAEKIQSERTYSISEIAPDDFASGMNYLGQELAATLFKHIHDLPLKQRKPEMFLRGIEALLTNLLKQKFANCDQHKILDDFCEHIHMGLNDNTFVDSSNKPTAKISKMNNDNSKPKNTDLKALVAEIDRRATGLLASGGHDALIQSLADVMVDVKPVLDGCTSKELDAFCQNYNGFYQVMKLLQDMAAVIKSGKIKVP